MSNQKCKAAHGRIAQRIAITEFNQNLCAGGVEGNESHFSRSYVVFFKNNLEVRKDQK